MRSFIMKLAIASSIVLAQGASGCTTNHEPGSELGTLEIPLQVSDSDDVLYRLSATFASGEATLTGELQFRLLIP